MPMPLALALALIGCPAPNEEPAVCMDQPVLFGVPDELTGLDTSQCAPRCDDCGGVAWSPPAYTADDFAAWRAASLVEPPASPTLDPYDSPPVVTEGADTVCAVEPAGAGAYRLATYDSTAAAFAADALPTHYGGCGLCSTLADLAVYAERPDLTEPVRQCGLDHLTSPAEEHVACLTALGFTEACAWIWYYNTVNTRTACASECFSALDDPWHTPDGALNPCLQCDEDMSGDVFKAVAGRTRRNTGLPSTMCRPCSEVRPVEHIYPL